MAVKRPRLEKPKLKKPELPKFKQKDLEEVLPGNAAFNRMFQAAVRLASETRDTHGALDDASIERFEELRRSLEKRRDSIKSAKDPVLVEALEAVGRSPDEVLGTMLIDTIELLKDCPRLAVMKHEERHAIVLSVLATTPFQKALVKIFWQVGELSRDCKQILGTSVAELLAAVVALIIFIIFDVVLVETGPVAVALLVLEIVVFILGVGIISSNWDMAWRDAECHLDLTPN